MKEIEIKRMEQSIYKEEDKTYELKKENDI